MDSFENAPKRILNFVSLMSLNGKQNLYFFLKTLLWRIFRNSFKCFKWSL